MVKNVVMAFKFGLMEINIKGFFKITKQMEKENLLIKMGMYIMETGKMIKLMDRDCIFMPMEQDIKVIGKMINSKVLVK